MNDADLEKLMVKPGNLVPKFNRGITEYSLRLPSKTETLNISPVTRDADASWTIIGHGNVRSLPLRSGDDLNLVIEVTAEDGSTKCYTIHLTVPSASLATIDDIKLSHGTLSPVFSDAVTEYTVNLPWHLSAVTMLPVAKDKDVIGANGSVDISLNYGETLFGLEITSPDKTSTKIFKVKFIKDRIIRMISVVNDDCETICCRICLGVLHCPVSVKQSQNPSPKKTIYCRKCLDTLTRTRKIDPLSEAPLTSDFTCDEYGVEIGLAEAKVYCCYKAFGCDEEMSLCQLGNHLKGCPMQPVLAPANEEIVSEKSLEKIEKLTICKMCSHSLTKSDVNTHLKWYCPAKHPNTKVDHVVELRDWEKRLQRSGQHCTSEQAQVSEQNSKGDMSRLQAAAENYACMIKMKPRNPINHFKLAVVLEEMFYAEDIWGCKAQDVTEQQEDKTFDNLMDINSNSSKEDEIRAICQAKGVREGASLPAILKAIDEEYHFLLDQNQSAKADYVQKLYAWKSKQPKDSLGRTADGCSFLAKALLKVLDAVACDPNNSGYHMHAGRLLLLQGQNDDAIKRLEAAFGLKPTSVEARFYLGLAYVKKYGRQHSQHLSPFKLLEAGVDYALYKLCEDACADFPQCSAEIFVRHSNVLILEGMLQLAHFLREGDSQCKGTSKKVADMYKQTSSLCLQLMNGITHRNKTYQDLQWIALRAQFSLGLFTMTELREKSPARPEDRRKLYEYWERLSALSRSFELSSAGSKVLSLQKRICEEAVVLCPSSSRSLYRLGDAQLAFYEGAEASDANDLKQAENSYRASMQFENKRVFGKEVSWMIKESDWWKERQEKERQAQAVPSTKPTSLSQSKTGPAPSKPLTKSSPAARGPSKPSQTTSAGKSSVPAKGKAVVPKGKPATTGSRAKVSTTPAKVQQTQASKESASPSIKKSGTSLEKTHSKTCVGAKKAPAKSSEKASNGTKSTPTDSAAKEETKGGEDKGGADGPLSEDAAVLNTATYHPRLGLARVLSRIDKDHYWGEIKQLYSDVIDMAPSTHDAYIELAEMVQETHPKQAIAVYCKYPFPKELGFDDAFLHGEIIRLSVKIEDFDNPHLEKSMIEYGNVMGFSSLDKTVEVLENKFKFEILKRVYSKIVEKEVNDVELQNFFKIKCWV